MTQKITEKKKTTTPSEPDLFGGNEEKMGSPTGRGKSSGKKKTKILKTGPVSGQRASSSQEKGLPGVPVERHFTKPGARPLDEVEYVKATSQIRDTDGSVVFEMKDIEVPASWSQLAIDILVSKYFRKAGVPRTKHEVSAKQVVHRISNTIRVHGESQGYFSTKEDAEAFEAELSFMLIHQVGAFNSPVWFNLGLWQQYKIKGSGGNYVWDPEAAASARTETAYQAPQCSACFIQKVDDDLMSIFDLIKNEARLFKYGSGTGTNFSSIRGRQEKLSGGGTSSGLMSFLEVLDRGAGATKSGGTTRRAAKMVCLDMDHPEIEDFVTWKSREEKKAYALMRAGYGEDFNSESYRTVSGQNSNNSVRIPDEFMRAVENDSDWKTRARTTGEVVETFRARDLWKKVVHSAWDCADPGVQFDTTINDWHTCIRSGRIHASNPCSEYMFLDDSACNLSSLNLVKFLKDDGSFDVPAYEHAIRVFILAQEILVGLSSYPTGTIAENSYKYRPLGLGYANLGTLLMLKGIPYDSDKGRAWAAALTATLCGRAYAVSAEEAGKLGPFEGFKKNRDSMLKVMGMHREAAYEVDQDLVPRELIEAARKSWDEACELGKQHGYRNAQATVLAPTGTIGLLMDCDTTGVEPDFALVKFKKLAGGGYFKIVNQSVPAALAQLGYSIDEIEEILRYVLGTMNFEKTPVVHREFLRSKGLKDKEIDVLQRRLPSVFDLSGVFHREAIGDEALKRIGVRQDEYEKAGFNFLKWAGLKDREIEEANEVICGTMTVEGAPHIKSEHLPIFDCANQCGRKGRRYIAPMGHVRMMAAVQPFLSGAISKTVNVPSETSAEEIGELYTQSWKLGLKAVAVYRDGCKFSQPLSTTSESGVESEEDELEDKLVQESPAAVAAQPSAQVTFAPIRRELPSKRTGFTQEASVGGHKLYLRTGEFPDGTLGEIFIDMHKEGAAYRSMMNCFAIAVSLGLQYGVPLREFVNKFTFTKFEPYGMVDGHPNIKMATSLVDYIFRVLGMEYLGRTDFLQVKPKANTTDIGSTGPRDPSSLIKSGVAMEGSDPQMKLNVSGETSDSSIDASSLSRKHGGAGQPHGAAGRSGEVVSEKESADHLAEMMGDAPPCSECGHTTVRNGACYRCLNCGNSMGCS